MMGVLLLTVPMILSPLYSITSSLHWGGSIDTQSISAPAAPVLAVRTGIFDSEASIARQVHLIGEARTNYAWAEIVLIYGGYPVTDTSIQVIVQWMSRENSPQSWWLRNNPLNNGWRTSGGYMGRNPTLYEAAEKVADALHTVPAYRQISAELSTGAVSPTAIMGSGWAAGHYGYHWNYGTVPVVIAPDSAW